MVLATSLMFKYLILNEGIQLSLRRLAFLKELRISLDSMIEIHDGNSDFHDRNIVLSTLHTD